MALLWRGYEDVGVASGIGGEGLCVLGADEAAGHHGAEEVAEGVIGVGFGLVGHGRRLCWGGRDARAPGLVLIAGGTLALQGSIAEGWGSFREGGVSGVAVDSRLRGNDG